MTMDDLVPVADTVPLPWVLTVMVESLLKCGCTEAEVATYLRLRAEAVDALPDRLAKAVN